MPKNNQIRPDPSNSPLAKWFAKNQGTLTLETAVSGAIQDLLTKTGQLNPPVALKAIATLRGIVRTIYSAKITGFGRLEPTREGFVVLLEKNWHWIRRREWWAHEIAHTFFFNLESRPPQKLLTTVGKDEELICDLLAREILIPAAFLKSADTTLGPPSIFELRRLCKLFQTTTSTMCRRLICDLKIWNAIMLFCETRQHMFPASKQVRNPGQALRIVHTIGPKSPGNFVPLNKRVEQIAVINEAFTKRRFVAGLASFHQFGELIGEREIQALHMVSGPTGRPGVMVMITSYQPFQQRRVPEAKSDQLSLLF